LFHTRAWSDDSVFWRILPTERMNAKRSFLCRIHTTRYWWSRCSTAPVSRTTILDSLYSGFQQMWFCLSPKIPRSAGLNSQSSSCSNQGECTVWQIDAHLDANSVPGVWNLEVSGTLNAYSVLQLKVCKVKKGKASPVLN